VLSFLQRIMRIKQMDAYTWQNNNRCHDKNKGLRGFAADDIPVQADKL